MGQTLKIKSGFDRSWSSTLRDADARAITTYPSDAIFDVAVARGIGEPTLFTPTATWIDAPSGTFKLTIAAAQTLNLDPGVYILQAGVTSGGIRSEAFDGQLEVTGVPGTLVLRIPYVTASDLAVFYPHLKNLAAYREDDTGFLTRRALASDEFDQTFLEHYKHMPKAGFVCRRPTVPETTIGLDEKVPDPAAVPPTQAEMEAHIAAGGLVLTRALKEIVARIAIADLMEGQETTGRNPYREEAPAMREEVKRLWRKYDIQIDTDDDGLPDLLVGREIVLLTEAP